MKYKKCNKCKKIKTLEEFSVCRASKDGRQSKCKECSLLYDEKYYIKHEEEIKGHMKKYYQDNKEGLNEYNKGYYKDNIEKAINYQEKWRKNNPEYQKEYKKNNKKTLNGKQRKRMQGDPTLRLNHNISNAIGRSLKEMKGGEPWEKLVGYTCEELKAHLKKQFLPGMTWENYGRGKGKWHMDHHPIPLYWFVFTSYKDKGFKKAWALENLRPMWGKDNCSKGNKLFHT